MAVAADVGADENVRDGGDDGLWRGQDTVDGGLLVKVNFQSGSPLVRIQVANCRSVETTKISPSRSCSREQMELP